MASPKEVREMMELVYGEIHHSRKIRGTEQAESIEDKHFREILAKAYTRIQMETGRHRYLLKQMLLPYLTTEKTV